MRSYGCHATGADSQKERVLAHCSRRSRPCPHVCAVMRRKQERKIWGPMTRARLSVEHSRLLRFHVLFRAWVSNCIACAGCLSFWRLSTVPFLLPSCAICVVQYTTPRTARRDDRPPKGIQLVWTVSNGRWYLYDEDFAPSCWCARPALPRCRTVAIPIPLIATAP